MSNNDLENKEAETQNSQTKSDDLSLNSPWLGVRFGSSFGRNSFYILFLSIAIIACHGFYVYSNENSWSHNLIDFMFDDKDHEDNKDKSALKREHKKVKELIEKWNEIESIDYKSDLTIDLRSQAETQLKSYKSFDSNGWTPRLKVSYLYHLAQLQIIYTDVSKEPFDIFLAIDNLRIAREIVTEPEKLSEKDDLHFQSTGMIARLDRSLLNALAFANFFSKTEKLQSELKQSLKKVGGCSYFVDKVVKHKLIKEVSGCLNKKD